MDDKAPVMIDIGKAEGIVKSMKQEASLIREYYNTLSEKVGSNHRVLNGLNSDKEDIRLRIRDLLNKRLKAEGPDFDEYQINSRTSRQYETISPQRKKSPASKKVAIHLLNAVDQPVTDSKAIDSTETGSTNIESTEKLSIQITTTNEETELEIIKMAPTSST